MLDPDYLPSLAEDYYYVKHPELSPWPYNSDEAVRIIAEYESRIAVNG